MLPNFYPVLPDFAWLERLVPLGVKLVQLRLKDAGAAEVRRQIAESLSLCRANDCQLVVNDYWAEAIDLGADFVHLGQEDLAGADVQAIRDAGIKLGISTHDESERAVALAMHPEYVALGPIYETKLKAMKWDPQGLGRVREWKDTISCPLVAIGGITLKRAADVYGAGADTIAVVTDIVTDPNPEDRVAVWLAQTGEFATRTKFSRR